MKIQLVTPRLRDELILSFSRSSGPGGQNVNKVNTKVTLSWNVPASEAIEESIRSRLLYQQARRIRESGFLTVTSQRFRSQNRNLDDCLEKLEMILRMAAIPEKKRKPTKPSKTAKRKRAQSKQRQAEVKQQRASRTRRGE